MIASGSSGLDAIKSKVTLKSIGVQLVGPAEFSPDFVSHNHFFTFLSFFFYFIRFTI